MEEDFCGKNPGVWWRNGYGINKREQQYVHMNSQPKNMQMEVGSESEINGQRRLPSGKRF